jgi:hypothetical protein
VDEEPKFRSWPIAVAGGAMLLCCLAPVLLASGATWLTGWLGGIEPMSAFAIAIAVGITVLVVRRWRSGTARDGISAEHRSLPEDR